MSEWAPFQAVNDEAVERGYRKCIEGAMGNTQVIVALELERKGGACPVCDKSFAAVEVENRFAHFTYYKPACFCFRVCERCGRFMVSERLLGIPYCTGCGYGKPVQSAKKASAARRRSGKDAATGEREAVE